MTEPLIPGSHCFLQPLAAPKPEEWSAYQQALYGLASISYKWHWAKANLPVTQGAGYDPYHPERPHLKQQQFHESPAKIKGFIGGIRSGKTVSGAAETVKVLLENPGIIAIASAPTYRMIKQSTKKTFYDILQPEAIHRKNDAECILTNGSQVLFRSTEDPDYIRGITAGVVWHDEGSYSVQEAFETLVGRLSQPGYDHRYILTTTPRGRNWVWNIFASPSKHSQADYVTVTVYDNPWIPPSTITTYEATYTTEWRRKQELMGEFTLPSGLVYSQFSQATHVGRFVSEVDGHLQLFGEPHEPGSREIEYLHDFGGRNPNVILVVTYDSDDRMYVIDEWYMTETDDDDIVKERRAFVEKYGKGRGIADSEDAKAIMKLNRENLPTSAVVKGPDSVEYGIRLVNARLKVQPDGKPRLFVDQRCVQTIDEFGLYQYEEAKDGKPVKDIPLKKDDHAMDAIRYGVLTRDRGKQFGIARDAEAVANKPRLPDSLKDPRDAHPMDKLLKGKFTPRGRWP